VVEAGEVHHGNKANKSYDTNIDPVEAGNSDSEADCEVGEADSCMVITCT